MTGWKKKACLSLPRGTFPVDMQCLADRKSTPALTVTEDREREILSRRCPHVQE